MQEKISGLLESNQGARARQLEIAKKLWALEQREHEIQREIRVERRKLLNEMAEQTCLSVDEQFSVQVCVSTSLKNTLKAADHHNQEVAAQGCVNVSSETVYTSIIRTDLNLICRSREAYLLCASPLPRESFKVF